MVDFSWIIFFVLPIIIPSLKVFYQIIRKKPNMGQVVIEISKFPCRIIILWLLVLYAYYF